MSIQLVFGGVYKNSFDDVIVITSLTPSDVSFKHSECGIIVETWNVSHETLIKTLTDGGFKLIQLLWEDV